MTVKGKGWSHIALGNPVPGNIPSCLDELGIDYRMSFDEALALCPSPDHDDSHPSWSINTETGIHNCFSCGYKGNFVQLVETVTGWERAQCVRWCRERGGTERVKERLKGSTPVKKENDTRKIINEASLALFEIPPLWACSERLITQDACEELGVLWNPERETWITPIRDPYTHKLWGWQEKNDRYFKNYPRTIKKSRTLFGLSAFEADQAILVESPLDVVRLRTVGIRGGVSSYGVHVSDEQLRILSEYADSIVVALDNDDAGIRKTEELKSNFRHLSLRFFNYTNCGDAKDIGEIATAGQITDGIRTATGRFRGGK